MLIPHGAALVDNGKQALALVARCARDAGIRTAVVPAYHCQTMITPFELEGFHIRPVCVADDLLLDPTALNEALTSEPSVILHCETYGNRADASLAHVFESARNDGHVLVVDVTHSILDGPTPTPHDWAMASLRKLLPVPAGAWVYSRAGQVAFEGVHGRDSKAEEIDEVGRALLNTQSRLETLTPRSPSWEEAHTQVCRLAERHEGLIELAQIPTAAAPNLVEMLGDQSISRRREEMNRTAKALRTRLGIPSRAALVNPGSAGCAALRTNRETALSLRAGLAEHGLWGPVEWDPPSRGMDADQWPWVATVPTDQPTRIEGILRVIDGIVG